MGDNTYTHDQALNRGLTAALESNSKCVCTCACICARILYTCTTAVDLLLFKNTHVYKKVADIISNTSVYVYKECVTWVHIHSPSEPEMPAKNMYARAPDTLSYFVQKNYRHDKQSDDLGCTYTLRASVFRVRQDRLHRNTIFCDAVGGGDRFLFRKHFPPGGKSYHVLLCVLSSHQFWTSLSSFRVLYRSVDSPTGVTQQTGEVSTVFFFFFTSTSTSTSTCGASTAVLL